MMGLWGRPMGGMRAVLPGVCPDAGCAASRVLGVVSQGEGRGLVSVGKLLLLLLMMLLAVLGREPL